jgi:hypothetical protein
MLLPEMPLEEWDEACLTLAVRQSRTVTTLSPLAHLIPQTRLRFIVWLMVAMVPSRREGLWESKDFQHLDTLIKFWGVCLHLLDYANSDSGAEMCRICGVSYFLPIWVETMVGIYSLDDLGSIPWGKECRCLER